MGWIVRLDEKGRLVIPNEVREKVGIKKGEDLVLEIKNENIILTKLNSRITEDTKKNELREFLFTKD